MFSITSKTLAVASEVLSYNITQPFSFFSVFPILHKQCNIRPILTKSPQNTSSYYSYRIQLSFEPTWPFETPWFWRDNGTTVCWEICFIFFAGSDNIDCYPFDWWKNLTVYLQVLVSKLYISTEFSLFPPATIVTWFPSIASTRPQPCPCRAVCIGAKEIHVSVEKS